MEVTTDDNVAAVHALVEEDSRAVVLKLFCCVPPLTIFKKIQYIPPSKKSRIK